MRYALQFTAVAVAACLSAACGTTRDVVTSTEMPSATGSSVLKTLQVAPSRVECTGVAPQLCLQVRESSDAAWTLLYEEIAGFEYEPGYLYEIRVKEEAVANPPADASAIRRTLVTILSKRAALVALAGPTWRLLSLEGSPVLAGTQVTAVFGDDSRVSGSAGCNGYFGRAKVADGQLAVGLLGATQMYCNPEGLMAQEGAYLSALEKATAYRIVGGQLHLGPAPGIVTLVYETK